MLFVAGRSALISVIFCVVLSGCEASSTGSVFIDGAPHKIELAENAPNGLLVEGIDVTINGEFLGTARRIGKMSGGALRSQVAFEPLQSRFGEIRIVQNIAGSAIGVNISFDVIVAGNFAGNVQLTTAI